MIGKSDPSRPFSTPMGTPVITEETKRAVRAAFEAMATWRQDMASHYDKNSAQMFDKMGDAARAMGWPTEIVDATRRQMQAMSRMQLQAIDNVMDVWQQQLTSANPATAAQAMLQKLSTMPAASASLPSTGAGHMPAMPGFDMNAMAGMNPMQIWMQAAEQWQKNWTQAMQYWAQVQRQTFDPATSDQRKDPKKPW